MNRQELATFIREQTQRAAHEIRSSHGNPERVAELRTIRQEAAVCADRMARSEAAALERVKYSRFRG